MPTPSPLLTLVGRMTVGQLATLVGLDIEGLVAAVLDSHGGAILPLPPNPRAGPGSKAPRRAVRATTIVARPSPPAPSVPGPPRFPSEPPLAALFGRVAYSELHRVLDRWLLDCVLEEHDGNVTHAAARLGITRRTLRERRARSRSVRLDAWHTAAPPAAPSSIPEPPSVATVLAQGGDDRAVRAAVDRWLLGGILDRERGNITQAALSLEMSRRALRQRWALVRV